ncbi:MAG: GTPase [Nanoarchaeota archaeon]|nr:GTPase [Nanoarchaeota archaeon]
MRQRYSFSSRRTGIIVSTNKHKQTIPHIVKEVIRISDLVLEILDARFIAQTRNEEIENLITSQGKKLVFVVNKIDLVNMDDLKQSPEFKRLKPYILFSCKSITGVRRLRDKIKMEIKRLKITAPQAHVGIMGYPNTGKSSLINLLIGKKSAGTSPQAGFTKGMQKLRLTKGILVLDTPGVYPEYEESPLKEETAKKHAEIGIRNFDKVKDPDIIVARLMKEYPGVFESHYAIEANGDSEILLEELGKKKHLVKKGAEVDTDRTARLILKDWQEGKIKSKQ